jgi:hypothetical protein
MKPSVYMLAGLVTAATFTLAPRANSGAVAPERAQLRAVSAQEALGSRTLPILRRLPAPGSDAAAARALDVLNNTRFATGAAPVRTTLGEAVMLEAADWLLEVRDNGGRVRCMGRGFTRRPVPPESQASYQDVITRGRRMLENELSPLVPLGPGEELVPVGVTYPGQIMMPRNGPQRLETVENHAHFGRLVNGIPVVGNGSKAVVMLDNDGNLLGFDVDWSVYEVTNQSQGTVSLTDINARLSSLGNTSLLPPDRRLEYVECGYYDAGSSLGNTWIQPACWFDFLLLRQGRSYARWKVVVPAGSTFFSEPSWPESVVLGGV